MASKWSIESAPNIKMLINMVEAAGAIDENENIFFPVEKITHGFLKISKDKLLEYASTGISIGDLYKNLLEQEGDSEWSDTSFDVQIPRSIPDPIDEEGPLT
jgi:ribosomal protein S16|tara:strand:- start:323 stop:628 length:306 start_codon:yes stop_codon:yes gene_type:complete